MKLLQQVGHLEGISLLALFFVAMPLKYVWAMPLAVGYAGWVHGVLFVAFVGLLLACLLQKKLTVKQTFIGFIAGLVPFGTFVFNAKVLEK